MTEEKSKKKGLFECQVCYYRVDYMEFVMRVPGAQCPRCHENMGGYYKMVKNNEE